VKVSYARLQSYFEKPLPAPEKLAELFTFHSFEVEGVERDVIDVKILPDRAHYCLSYDGIAEEVSLLTQQPIRKDRSSQVNQSQTLSVSIKSAPIVTIQDTNFCHRYMGRIAEGVSIANSPTWLSGTLVAVGERSINSIVDAGNITMLDTGQPLHIFDADKVVGAIVVRAAHQGEKILLLGGNANDTTEKREAGREITLSSEDFVIADDHGPLAIAGVKGGKRAEITPSTTRIIIESAHFDPVAIRRTSTRLNLRNESSKRFENEITSETTASAMDALSALIQVLCPNAKFGPIVDQYPVTPAQTIISIDPAYVSERLGINVPEKTMKDILSRMEIGIEIDTATKWRLTIPFRRLDLTIPDDIVEEIGRMYGYEHVKGILPKIDKNHPPALLRGYYAVEKIKDILVEAGFSEVSLYSFAPTGEIEIAYPLTSEKAFFRENLAGGMRVCLKMNMMNAELLGEGMVRIFEIGVIVSGGAERLVLSLGVGMSKKTKGVTSTGLIEAAVTAVSDTLSMPKIMTEGMQSICEIDIQNLVDSMPAAKSARSEKYEHITSAPKKYAKISPYPFIVRDIAVFVPESISESRVWSEIEKGIASVPEALNLLARHAIFDTFKKDGKTSYAFRMVFQAPDRTLTDIEANAIMEKIYAHMSAQAWQVR
jgi:phenylalanyl-tRNA synthetase beta chain